MSILVDTSIWIDHLSKGDAKLTQLLNNGLVLTHPLIIGELACGSMSNRGEVMTLLAGLPRVRCVVEDELLVFIQNLELWGKDLGLIDVHLLASTRLEGVRLCTRDKRLKKAAENFGLAWS